MGPYSSTRIRPRVGLIEVPAGLIGGRVGLIGGLVGYARLFGYQFVGTSSA